MLMSGPYLGQKKGKTNLLILRDFLGRFGLFQGALSLEAQPSRGIEQAPKHRLVQQIKRQAVLA